MKLDFSACVAPLRLGVASRALSGIRVARNTAQLNRAPHIGWVRDTPFTVPD